MTYSFQHENDLINNYLEAMTDGDEKVIRKTERKLINLMAPCETGSHNSDRTDISDRDLLRQFDRISEEAFDTGNQSKIEECENLNEEIMKRFRKCFH